MSRQHAMAARRLRYALRNDAAKPTCFLRIALDVAVPLRQRKLEDIKVDLHDLLEGENALGPHPVDRVRLAATHWPCGKDDPWMLLVRGRRVDEAADQLILHGLPLCAVDAVIVGV
eukprot:6175492-Pleurochrysis_carterae.AAC.5